LEQAADRVSLLQCAHGAIFFRIKKKKTACTYLPLTFLPWLPAVPRAQVTDRAAPAPAPAKSATALLAANAGTSLAADRRAAPPALAPAAAPAAARVLPLPATQAATSARPNTASTSAAATAFESMLGMHSNAHVREYGPTRNTHLFSSVAFSIFRLLLPRDWSGGALLHAASPHLERGNAAPALLPLRPRGLTNSTNVCFANTILQAFVACRPLTELVRSLPSPPPAGTSAGGAASALSSVALLPCMRFLHEFKVPPGWN
jgi:hypothetical protein